jgi:hypothetical protein
VNTPNPYLAPGAALSGLESGKDTYEPKLWAWRGRIGRLRYMAYLFIVSILNMVPVTILMGLLGAAGILSQNQDALVDVAPGQLSAALIGRYLDIKESGQL